VNTGEFLLVVDFGTSGVTSSAVNPRNGSILASGSSKYTWLHPETGLTEIDPNEIWDCSQEAIRELLNKVSNPDQCLAMTFCFFGDNLIPVDESGHAIDNLIPATDGRSREQVPQLLEEVTPQTYYETTGAMPDSMCIGSKILWLKEHRPSVYREARHFDHIQEYIFRRMGFGGVSDYPMASRKMVYDIRNHEWVPSLIEPLGIPADTLYDTLHESTEILGTLETYGDVDLPKPLPVVPGSHDVTCAMIGTGATAGSGDHLGNVIGTWDMFVRLVHEPNLSFEDRHDRCWFYCGPTRDTYSFMALLPAGALLEWFVDEIQPGSPSFEELFDSVEFNGENDLVVIPYLNRSEGHVLGMDLSTTRSQIFQSLVEGICFESRTILRAIDRIVHFSIERVSVGGGASRSDKWMQLKSNVTRTPYQTLSNPEISTLGAAVIGACALGVYDSIEEGAAQMVYGGTTFEPEPDRSERYSRNYERYTSMMESLGS